MNTVLISLVLFRLLSILGRRHVYCFNHHLEHITLSRHTKFKLDQHVLPTSNEFLIGGWFTVHSRLSKDCLCEPPGTKVLTLSIFNPFSAKKT
jgi:hypothetical protein